MPPKKPAPLPPSKYRVVDSSLLDRSRRGKHYDLILGIVRELKAAEDGAALEIPLDDIGGIGLPNLRSAVHRGAIAAGLEVETLADDKNFYVWKTRPIKVSTSR
jgi:hypothetical protein